MMQVLGYFLAASGLALVALERAQRSRHLLRSDVLIAFGAAGSVATVVISLEQSLTPVLIVIFACVAICAATDLSSGLIYNSVVAGAACVAVVNAVVGDAVGSLSGAALGFGLAMVPRILTRGRGLGLGDVRLFALVGSGIGVVAVAYCFGGAFVLGALVSVGLIAAARVSRSAPVRFAPYIAIATMMTSCINLGRV